MKPYLEMTDEELMHRTSRGSDSAFEELYRRYARRLQGFFFRQLGGDVDSAADFTHDVFLRIYEARDRYETGTNVATWFFTIAYNLCRNHHRNHRPSGPRRVGFCHAKQEPRQSRQSQNPEKQL